MTKRIVDMTPEERDRARAYRREYNRRRREQDPSYGRAPKRSEMAPDELEAKRAYHREYARKWRAENPKRDAATRKRHRERRDADPVRAQAHREYMREYARYWREENIEKERARKRRMIAENPEKHRDLAKQWRSENPMKVRAAASARRKKRVSIPAPRTKSRWLPAEDLVVLSPDFANDIHRAVAIGRSADAVAHRRRTLRKRAAQSQALTTN